MKKILMLTLCLISSITYASTHLKIGTSPQNPPFADVANKNTFFGFDIDIMMEICKRIPAQCTFTPVLYNNLFSEVLNHKIDLAISAIIISSEETPNFLFSLPYLESRGRFLTLSENNINTPNNIEGKKVGTRKGTPFKNFATNLYHKITIKEYNTVEDLLLGLKNKEIDIIIINDAAARYWHANTGNTYKLVGTSLPVGNGYAIMARRNQEELIKKINAALLSLEADGTYLKIYSRYFSD